MVTTAEGSGGIPESIPVAAHEHIFQWLEKYIDDRQIEIGGALPSEDEIMRETQMSRTTVREAITRLRALGIVATRRKRGMWLTRSPKLLDLVRILSGPEIPPGFMGHAGGYRCALELGFASEIFQRATPEDVAELRRIYEKMVETGSNPDAWNDYDRQFHLKLIAFSRNEIAIWMSQLLNPFFETLRPMVPPLSEHVRVLHEGIVVALERRDADAFYQGIYEHDFWKLSFDKVSWFAYPTTAGR